MVKYKYKEKEKKMKNLVKKIFKIEEARNGYYVECWNGGGFVCDTLASAVHKRMTW